MFKHIEKEGAYRAKPWRLFLSLVGGLVLLIGIVLLAWSMFLRSPMRPSAPSVQYSPPLPPLPLTVAYEDVVKQSLAQQLYVDVSQLVHETQANQDGLFGVAYPFAQCFPVSQRSDGKPRPLDKPASRH
jgi:hypothetical protein